MKTIITAKLKLHTTPEQFVALRAIQLAYRDALNYVSQYAFAHGKMSNKVKLQDGTYDEVRARFHLPSQMACSVPRQVGATYKTLWNKVKKNAAARQAGHTKKRYKGLDKAPKYVSPTLTYQDRKDYTLKKDQQVSILTLDGRVIVPYTGYNKHVAILAKSKDIGAALLWYDKPHKHFYLLVSLEVETADPTPQTHTGIVGVDVGVRYLAVASTTKGQQSFSSGKRVVSQANHYARLRKRLQKKGTRSATRRLVVISGRERRLKADANHVVSKRIVTQHPHSLIGLEHLTDIRERTKRRTHQRKKHGKGVERVSAKQRSRNRVFSQWSFAELHAMIAYKALLASSMAIKVDAHYTSKACPVCGHTADGNRPNKGLLFLCQNCHYTLHADLVGARNVAMRTLLVRQDWSSTGQLSVAPDVSSVEIKAARLQRYAELRWSLGTSPAPVGLSFIHKFLDRPERRSQKAEIVNKHNCFSLTTDASPSRPSKNVYKRQACRPGYLTNIGENIMHISEPAEYAILGLLEECPMHGYELHQRFQSKPLEHIVHIEMGQLYAFLKKLEHLRCIEASQSQQGRRPQRKVYHLTASGRAVLQEWLTTPVERPRDIRIFFLLKLYFLQRLAPEHLASVIEQEIAACQHFLAVLAAQREGPCTIRSQAAFDQVVLRSRMYQTEALLAWLHELQAEFAQT